MTTHTMPQRMLDAAICAYNVDIDRDFKPKCKFWDPIGLPCPKEIDYFLDGPNGVNAGFVGFTTDGWAVVSLRGTLPSFYDWTSFKAFLEDWWQDDETKPVPFQIDAKTTVHVEKGFCKALYSLWPNIVKALAHVDWSKVKGIQVTGHSKGAGLTFLVAALLLQQFPKAQDICVHAFAAPLAGQADFANWYKGTPLEKNTTRYQRACDIVPFVPPSASWNIFDHLSFITCKGIFPTIHKLAGLFEILGESAYGGYVEVGSMVFLPDPASSATPETGHTAIHNARRAIIDVIEADHPETIAEAHSAVHSYWPALFHKTPDHEDNKTVSLE